MDFVVWESSAAGNACWLDPVENFDRARALRRGVPFGSDFPKGVQFRMSKQHKKDTALTDDLGNSDSLKICSARLVDHLKKAKTQHVEYLPVVILDHKGKVASADYRIVNPFPPQDVLDLKASGPTYSAIHKSSINDVKRLVIDPKRVEPGVRIFRIKGFTNPVLVDRKLAEEIAAEGFVGAAFIELDEYES